MEKAEVGAASMMGLSWIQLYYISSKRRMLREINLRKISAEQK